MTHFGIYTCIHSSNTGFCSIQSLTGRQQRRNNGGWSTARQGKRGTVENAKHGRGATGTGINLNRRKKSKLVVTFDPDKRKYVCVDNKTEPFCAIKCIVCLNIREYLTGFHKRKQERRRFGLDMEAYKVKKRQLEAKKQRREEQKEKLAALHLRDEEKANNEEHSDFAVDVGKNKMKSVLSGDKVVTKVTTFHVW